MTFLWVTKFTYAKISSHSKLAIYRIFLSKHTHPLEIEVGKILAKDGHTLFQYHAQSSPPLTLSIHCHTKLLTFIAFFII